MTHSEVVDIQITDLIELTEGHEEQIQKLILAYSELRYKVEKLESMLNEYLNNTNK
jgi:hypothetical protein